MVAWIAIFLSSVSLAISFLTYFFDIKIRKHTSEVSLKVLITDARNQINQKLDRFEEINQLPNEAQKVYKVQVEERLEEYLNSLDYACDKYLSKILDKKSFKRNFKKLILEVSTDKNFSSVMDNDSTYRFSSLKQVIKEFSEGINQ